MAEHAADLVEEVYAVTVDPDRYDQLMRIWEGYIGAQVQALEGPEQRVPSDKLLERHVKTALKIFDQIGRNRRTKSSAEAFLARLPVAAAIVNQRFAVVAANAGAKLLLGEGEQPRLDDLEIDELSAGKLRSWMAGRTTAEEPVLLLPCFLGARAAASCLAVTRVDLSCPLTGVPLELDVQDGPHFLLMTVDFQFDPAIGQALIQTYGLSIAEASVAIALAEGASPSELAEHRGVSLHTIRTQIKATLRKLNASAIPDLVRIVSGFAATVVASRSLGRAEPRHHNSDWRREKGLLRLRDGRRLAYEDSGSAKGRPVLFIHNMLLGPAMTDAAIEVAGRKDWRFIAPSRPGFGQSDALVEASGTAVLDIFVRDVEELLDHLEIEQATLIGHLSGGVQALGLAERLPNRLNGLVLVNYVPSYNVERLMDLPVRQRAFGRTIHYAPKLLPFIARAGAAQIDAGCEDQLLRALHGGIPADMAALGRPEVLRAATEGLRHAIQQGPAAFCADCPLVISDWSALARRISMPAHLLLGAEDRFMLPDYGRDFVEANPKFELSVVDNAGMYLLYTHWPRVFDSLEQLNSSMRVPFAVSA